MSLLSPADLVALQPGSLLLLSTLSFSTLSLGTSPLTFSGVILGNEFGMNIPNFSVQSGSISVIAQQVTEPGTLLLLVTGLGLAAIALQRIG